MINISRVFEFVSGRLRSNNDSFELIRAFTPESTTNLNFSFFLVFFDSKTIKNSLVKEVLVPLKLSYTRKSVRTLAIEALIGKKDDKYMILGVDS